jgi:hypothetical protein
MAFDTSHLISIGTTGCGKSFGEVLKIIEAANEYPPIGICVVDPHKHSLAWQCLAHLVRHGHKKRIIWDSLDEIEHTPKYKFLARSRATHPLIRAKEHQEQSENFAELLVRRQDESSLAGSPQKEEWTMKATQLLLNQPVDYPASDLRYCLRPGHWKFDRLFREVTVEDVKFEFMGVANGSIKQGQYASSRRLIDAVCGSPSFIVRCGIFDIGKHLDRGGILLVEGGGISQPVLQTILGSISLQVIQHARMRP